LNPGIEEDLKLLAAKNILYSWQDQWSHHWFTNNVEGDTSVQYHCTE